MENESERLVVFDEYADAVEANIVKGVLETNGIPCMLTNENMSSILPLTWAVSKVKLFIFAKDLDTAKRIMSEKSEL